MTNENNKPHLFDILQSDVNSSLDNVNQILKLFDIEKFTEENPELQEKLMKMKNKYEVLYSELEKEKGNWEFGND
jgi:predicted RNase H-like nuclease (RuvC/YqgF family)